jgi:acetyl-CoA decarbonylase/synthase complex subunit gamma
MAKKLTGLQIQKLLPKTNCKECGSNTCLAFAMKLAAQKAELSDCPYASDEAKSVLGAASEPPVRGIVLGPDKKLRLGEETVIYRHEKTFVNQTAIAVNINDDEEDVIAEKLKNVKEYILERVGEILTIDLIAVTQNKLNASDFSGLVKKCFEVTGKPILARVKDKESAESAVDALKGSGSVILVDFEYALEVAEGISKNGLVIGVSASNLEDMVKTTTALKESGINDIIMNFKTDSLAELFQSNTIARRMALKESYKPLGYPTVTFAESGNETDDTITAINEITKYGGICVLPSFEPAQLSALMTLRLNIYTDPQKPIQVEPKIYPVGEPDAKSPVFVTTNFSLTYFIVSGEIENSGASAWLLVPECEGMSVLTAWAAGKFSGSSIAKFAKEAELETKVESRQIIIPGYVAQISGELEECMPGWKVLVGPQEAADIESYVKSKIS